MTFWWLLFGIVFVCQGETNKNDWAHWADWKQWMSANNAGTDNNQKNHYWNNYGNWKQWAEHAQGGGGNNSPYGNAGGQGGSPWSSTPYGGGGNGSPHGNAGGGNRSPYGAGANGGNSSPYSNAAAYPSKENFDNWRKWNLEKESEHGDDWKNYGRWQTWAEKNGEGDYAAYVSFADWNNRDKIQPQEAFNADVVLMAAAAKGHDGHKGGKSDHDGGKHGHQAKQEQELHFNHRTSKNEEADKKAVDDKNAKESFEQWVKRNKYVTDNKKSSERGGHKAQESATHHEEVKERTYEHHTAGANEHQSDRESASGSEHATDKLNWESYAQGWQKYIPGSGGNNPSAVSDYSAGGGDWQQYMPKSGGNNPSSYSDYSAGGGDWQQYMPKSGTTSKDGHFSEGGDWSKYVPEAYRASIDQGVMGGQGKGSPQSASATDYQDFVPNEGAFTPQTLVAPAADELPKPGYGLNDNDVAAENKQIDWRKYVPESYLHFIPDDKFIQEQNARNENNGNHPQPEHPSVAKRWDSRGHGDLPEVPPRRHGEQPEEDWRGAIPKQYRDHVPDKETIEKLREQEKRENLAGHRRSPPMVNAAALYQPESTSYNMGWMTIALCLAITVTAVVFAYNRYSKRLQYDNLKDTRIARSEATDVDHLLLV